MKDTSILWDIRNCLCLLQVTPLQFSIEVNIDSANFRFPFFTRCTLSKKKRSELSEPLATVQQLSYVIYIKNDLDNFAFKISLTSLISTRLIDQLASRGSNHQWQYRLNYSWIEMFEQFLQYHLQSLHVNLEASYLSHIK